MAQDIAPVPCISCRLRRKKCDRRTPWCGRCQKLHIPQEWCIYQNGIKLYDKDSDTTLDRQQRLNRDLKRELDHTQLMLDFLHRHRERTPDGDPHRLFFGGLHRNASTTLWGSGYHGAACVPATLPSESAGSMGDSALIVFTKLFEERRKQNAERNRATQDQSSVLSRFENLCLGSLVEFPEIKGDALILELIEEINHLLPPRDGINKLLTTIRQVNLPRYVLGPPVYPECIIQEMESLIKYDDRGGSKISINLPKESDRLVFLSLLLLSLSKAQFILQSIYENPSPPGSNVNHIIYHRYAAAILRIDLIGEKIHLPDAAQSLPLTLALVEHHLALDYNPSANLRLSDDGTGPDRVMTTRSLISRAKFQHMHQDMINYYPELSKEERQMYNDTWFLLVYMDLMDSIEYGYYSSVQVADFHAGAYTEMTTIGALRTSHEVLNEVNLLDGELSPDELIEYLHIGIKKLKTAYLSLDYTISEDGQLLRNLDFTPTGPLSQPPPTFRQIIERIYTRLVLLGIIQSLYAMLKRCVTELGETPENSQRALVFDIIAHKAALTGLNLLMINFANVHEKDQDPNVRYLFKHTISLTQDASGFEIISATKSLIWLGATIMKHTGLSSEEIAHYVLYQKEDEEMDQTIIARLSEQPQFKNLPRLVNFDDFDIDDDPAKLIEQFKCITDPKVVTFLISSIFWKMRSYLNMFYYNFSFVKLSRTFMLGIRFSTFALKCFFPEEVKLYQLQAREKQERTKNRDNTGSNPVTLAGSYAANPTPLSTYSDESNTPSTVTQVKQEQPATTRGENFIGTFADLFQEGIETSKEFDLSEYFGSSYDENLQESWAGDFISSVGFEFPGNN